MKKIHLLSLSAIVFLLASCGDPQQKNTPGDASSQDDGQSLRLGLDDAQKLEFGKLKLYPIYAQSGFDTNNPDADRCLNLREAMERNAVVIKESDLEDNIDANQVNSRDRIPSNRTASNAVNTLSIINSSTEPVYLMAGDVIGGGKQDRVIAEDMIVAAGQKINIPVYCVEPHRWAYPSASPSDENSNGQHFAFYGNTASSNVRRAVVYEQNQERVWEEVGVVTSINNAKTSTGTYNALQENESFTAEAKDYLNFFTNAFAHSTEIVGVIAVSGNKVLGCDIFATPALFRKQYVALINAYVTDVVSFGTETKASDEAAKTFFKTCLEEVDAPVRNRNDKNRKFTFKGRLMHYTALS